MSGKLSDAWIEGDEGVRVPREVRNAGSGTLRFVAVCADTDVVTTYEREVAPDGSRERRPLS